MPSPLQTAADAVRDALERRAFVGKLRAEMLSVPHGHRVGDWTTVLIGLEEKCAELDMTVNAAARALLAAVDERLAWARGQEAK